MVVPEQITEDSVRALIRELQLPVFLDGALIYLEPTPGLAGLTQARGLLSKLEEGCVLYRWRKGKQLQEVKVDTLLRSGDSLLILEQTLSLL